MELMGITGARSLEELSFARASSGRRRRYGDNIEAPASRASGRDTVTLSQQTQALLREEKAGQPAESDAAAAFDETDLSGGKNFIENVSLKVFRVSVQSSPDYEKWVDQLENGNPAQFLAALNNLAGGAMSAGEIAAALAKADDDELTEIAKAMGAFTGIEDNKLFEQLSQIRSLGLKTIGTDDTSLRTMAKQLGDSFELDPEELYDFLSELRGELENWNAERV